MFVTSSSAKEVGLFQVSNGTGARGRKQSALCLFVDHPGLSSKLLNTTSCKSQDEMGPNLQQHWPLLALAITLQHVAGAPRHRVSR